MYFKKLTNQQEALGHSEGLSTQKSSCSAVVKSKEELMHKKPLVTPEDLSTLQCQELLAQCRLQEEQNNLETSTCIKIQRNRIA